MFLEQLNNLSENFKHLVILIILMVISYRQHDFIEKHSAITNLGEIKQQMLLLYLIIENKLMHHLRMLKTKAKIESIITYFSTN